MTKQSPYEKVTARLVEMMEQGVRPWAPNYLSGSGIPLHRPTRQCGMPYQGINVLILWAAASMRGFQHGQWMTYKQAQSLGGQVRKGERGEQIVFFKKLVKEEENSRGEIEERVIPMIRVYTVFNVDQIDGLPQQYYAKPAPSVLSDDERIAQAEAFLAGTRAQIEPAAGNPCYIPFRDVVQLVPFERYKDAQGYYCDAFHELTHWTGSEKRLHRFENIGGVKLKDRAFEELVAEIGSAFLAADMGFSLEPREDHAAYLASWIKALKDDSRFIFKAAAAAEKACGFLHDLQPSLDRFAIAAE